MRAGELTCQYCGNSSAGKSAIRIRVEHRSADLSGHKHTHASECELEPLSPKEIAVAEAVVRPPVEDEDDDEISVEDDVECIQVQNELIEGLGAWAERAAHEADCIFTGALAEKLALTVVDFEKKSEKTVFAVVDCATPYWGLVVTTEVVYWSGPGEGEYTRFPILMLPYVEVKWMRQTDAGAGHDRTGSRTVGIRGDVMFKKRLVGRMQLSELSAHLELHRLMAMLKGSEETTESKRGWIKAAFIGFELILLLVGVLYQWRGTIDDWWRQDIRHPELFGEAVARHIDDILKNDDRLSFASRITASPPQFTETLADGRHRGTTTVVVEKGRISTNVTYDVVASWGWRENSVEIVPHDPAEINAAFTEFESRYQEYLQRRRLRNNGVEQERQEKEREQGRLSQMEAQEAERLRQLRIQEEEQLRNMKKPELRFFNASVERIFALTTPEVTVSAKVKDVKFELHKAKVLMDVSVTWNKDHQIVQRSRMFEIPWTEYGVAKEFLDQQYADQSHRVEAVFKLLSGGETLRGDRKFFTDGVIEVVQEDEIYNDLVTKHNAKPECHCYLMDCTRSERTRIRGVAEVVYKIPDAEGEIQTDFLRYYVDITYHGAETKVKVRSTETITTYNFQLSPDAEQNLESLMRLPD